MNNTPAKKKSADETVSAPKGKRLGDLPGLLASLPRPGVENAEDFARDLAAIRKGMEIGLGEPDE